MRVLGIDPGLTGALALHGESAVTVHDMPVITRTSSRGTVRTVNLPALKAIIADMKPDHAFVEYQQAFPGNSSHNTFSLGRTFGNIEAVLAALDVPVTFVTPRQWKSHFAVPPDKGAARSRATQLMPAHADLWLRSKDHNRAEAAIIGLYGLKRAA